MREDAELLEAWRGGDSPAGQELFGRYSERVCRFFLNKVDGGIDDLIQQTFLACVESRDKFRGDSRFLTYLLGIAKNVLKMHYYKRRRHGEMFDMAQNSVHDVATSPSLAVVRLEQHRVLLEALRRIPLDAQIALELHFWEDLSLSEVAAVLEVPVGTAKSRVRRAKQALHEEIVKLAAGSQLDTTIDNLERWARSIRDQVQIAP